LAIKPHLDSPNELSLGTHINVSHEAATPPGFIVTATVELIKVEGRKLKFSVSAYDGVDLIAQGTHDRFIVDKAKFENKLNIKRGKL
jgi:fluoroacetyl-CoA thioesterase